MSRMILIALLVATELALGAPQLEKQSPEPPDSAEAYEKILDQVMPVEVGDLWYQLADRYEWVFIARIAPPFDAESLFVVKKPFSGDPVEAILIQPRRQIFAEWTDRWSGERDITVAKAAARVKTVRREYRGDTCPALPAFSKKLEAVRIPAMPEIGLMMDATRYEILTARSVSAQRSSYSGPGSQAPSQPNELLEAVESLRRDIAKCSQR